ncbi:hypothetical protein Ciccas_001525 [Cichlidogyrus casuarinus]|uniref:Protein kinase domain-containing protein n=1 Tax=Cichlidogyrus casuarinus TaxID=1844966 RepID=A0ABD2QJW8_9PLAT
MENCLIKDRFKFVQVVSFCPHGSRWKGIDTFSGKEIYAKLYVKSVELSFWYEVQVLKDLRNFPNLPNLLWHGQVGFRNEEYDCIIYEMLGPNLEEVMSHVGKFTFRATVLLAQKLLKALETLHKMGYVHRKLQPKHILIGKGIRSSQFYLVGMKDWKRYNLASNDDKGAFIGHINFASLRSHNHLELGPADDLISLVYILIHLNQQLPWSILENKDRLEDVKEAKTNVRNSELCRNFPPEFKRFLDHCMSLELNDKPDYELLYSFLDRIAKLREFKQNHLYEWSFIMTMSRNS